jgi:hypothetical protein
VTPVVHVYICVYLPACNAGCPIPNSLSKFLQRLVYRKAVALHSHDGYVDLVLRWTPVVPFPALRCVRTEYTQASLRSFDCEQGYYNRAKSSVGCCVDAHWRISWSPWLRFTSQTELGTVKTHGSLVRSRESIHTKLPTPNAAMRWSRSRWPSSHLHERSYAESNNESPF